MTKPSEAGTQDPYSKIMASHRRLRRINSLAWMVVPFTLIVGVAHPAAGLVMLACMGVGLALAITRGRQWCSFCPRGSMFRTLLKGVSVNRPAPRIFHSLGFRLVFLVAFMTVFMIQAISGWGSPTSLGRALLRVIIMSSTIGLVLGFVFHPSAWCVICPMGTMTRFLGKARHQLSLEPDACTRCGLCARVCPIGIDPRDHMDVGRLAHRDCLKCLTCAAKCPRRAILLPRSARADLLG